METLDHLKAGRDATIKIMTAFPINGPEYMKALEMREGIDRLAGLLTGDPNYFWPQGHSTKG